MSYTQSCCELQRRFLFRAAGEKKLGQHLPSPFYSLGRCRSPQGGSGISKLKLASYWAAACGGCDTAILDINEKILAVAAAADVLFWPIALDFKYKNVEAMPHGHIDATLFHGAECNSENEHLEMAFRLH